MNAKTARLLRKVSVQNGISNQKLKDQWNRTPANKRHALRLELESTIEVSFFKRVQEWQRQKDFIQKEAADFLRVPFETYRSWYYGINKPSALAIPEIERRMKL